MTTPFDTLGESLQQAAAHAQSTYAAYRLASCPPDEARRVPLRSSGTMQRVPLLVFEEGRRVADPDPTWDRIYWIERYEDLYAVPGDGRVLVVHRPFFQEGAPVT